MRKDERVHQKLMSTGLAFRDIISWRQLPIQNEDGQVEIRNWPMILPHRMVCGSCVIHCMLLHQ